MEIWKPIPEYESHYEASTYGRVRSLNKLVKSGLRHNKTVTKRGRVLKPNKHRDGYLKVTLGKNGKVRTHMVHRLVAKAHLKNTDEYPAINHKNGIKADNRADNLEWCDYKHNSKHRIEVLGQFNPNRKEIYSPSLDKHFVSSFQAALWLNDNVFDGTKQVPGMARNIRAAVTGKKKSAFGNTWKDV